MKDAKTWDDDYRAASHSSTNDKSITSIIVSGIMLSVGCCWFSLYCRGKANCLSTTGSSLTYLHARFVNDRFCKIILDSSTSSSGKRPLGQPPPWQAQLLLCIHNLMLVSTVVSSSAVNNSKSRLEINECQHRLALLAAKELRPP